VAARGAAPLEGEDVGVGERGEPAGRVSHAGEAAGRIAATARDHHRFRLGALWPGAAQHDAERVGRTAQVEGEERGRRSDPRGAAARRVVEAGALRVAHPVHEAGLQQHALRVFGTEPPALLAVECGEQARIREETRVVQQRVVERGVGDIGSVHRHVSLR